MWDELMKPTEESNCRQTSVGSQAIAWGGLRGTPRLLHPQRGGAPQPAPRPRGVGFEPRQPGP